MISLSSLLKKKKGQVFIEFFFIFLIAMIAFILFLAVGIRYWDSLKANHDSQIVNQLLDDFKLKVLAASNAESDFNSTMEFPARINEYNYNINLEDSVLIIEITTGSSGELVSDAKALPEITGTVQKDRCNLITKNDTEIHVEPIGPLPC